MASSILIIFVVGFAVVSSVNLPDCLNCEVCVKAVPIRESGCSLPSVFNGNLDTCVPEEPPTSCPDAVGTLQVYDLYYKKFLENPSVTYDFTTSRFTINENGGGTQPTDAIINNIDKTVFFVDYDIGYIANPTVDANGKAVGYSVDGYNYDFPSELFGIYTVTTKGDIIPA